MASLPSQPLPPDLVAYLERADEAMEKKSGLARDLPLDKVAELGISDPRLIPSFLGEDTRIALHNEQLSMVRQLSVRAREAEKVHGLPIDEEYHCRVFREFPSLGTLGAAKLTVEAASLLQRYPTGEALSYFIGLVVDHARTEIPSYPRFVADVRRLTDAAGTDRVAVENHLLRDLPETAYLSRAPENFWRSYHGRPVGLAGQNPQIRSTLFGLNPIEIESDTWLDLIEAAGIADELRSGDRGTVAWLRRFVDSCW